LGEKIKVGYKKTEVGVIPEDWEVFQISDSCQLVNGRGFKPHEWQTTGLPIIRIQNLNGSEDFNLYSGQYNPKILVEHGQLLFAWSGSRGTSFGPHVWNGPRALLNYHTWKVVVNESNVTPDFLFYALRQLTIYIEDRAHGASALVHTQKWEMEKFPIVMPKSLPEQRAIAGALSDVDALLGSLVRLIAKKRDLKQAAMQQLLTGRTRLPGFKGEWEVKRLEQSCELVTKGTTPTSIGRNFTAAGVNFLKAESIAENGTPIPEKVAFIDTATHKLLKRSQLKEGDLLISIAGVLGRVGCVSQEILPANTNQALAIIRLGNSSELDRNFLFYCLRSPMTTKQISDVNVQAAQANISLQNVRDLEINVPPSIPEQIAIAAVLSDMDAELTSLEQRREKTKALKQAMMQELLTGRTRLV
jgi:type I restriction enzyme S subunit